MLRSLMTGLAVGALIAAGACGPGAPDTAGQTAPADDGDAADGTARFVAVDIDYSEAPTRLSAGSTTVELVNEGDLQHTVTIEELDDETVVDAAGGETVTGDVELEPGTYTYYCEVPGHRDAGMEGTLEVE